MDEDVPTLICAQGRQGPASLAKGKLHSRSSPDWQITLCPLRQDLGSSETWGKEKKNLYTEGAVRPRGECAYSKQWLSSVGHLTWLSWTSASLSPQTWAFLLCEDAVNRGLAWHWGPHPLASEGSPHASVMGDVNQLSKPDYACQLGDSQPFGTGMAPTLPGVHMSPLQPPD